MPWGTRYLEAHNVVETVFSGVLERGALQEAVAAALTLGSRHKATRHLADCRDLARGGAIVEVYRVVRLLTALRDLDPAPREAILLPSTEAAQGNLCFYGRLMQTIVGIEIRLFDDREVALAWLTQPQPSGG